MASLPGERDQAGAPDPGRLTAALATLGFAAVVEMHGRLAVLTVHGQARLPDAALRAAIVEASRAAGFSSVAVELAAGADGAG